MEHHHESLFHDPRFWVGVSFVIFFVIFGRKLWIAVARMLDNRAETIRSELDEAARLRREAEAILEDAKARRAAALAEADSLMARAREEARRTAAAAREDMRAAAARRERLAVDRISAAEKAAVSDVRKTAAEVAVHASERLLSEDFSSDSDARFIDHAIQELPRALSARHTA